MSHQSSFTLSHHPLHVSICHGTNYLSKLQVQKSQITYSTTRLSETLGMIYPGAKYFSLCGLMKLEDKYLVPRHTGYRIMVMDIPNFKKKEKSGVTSPKQFKNLAVLTCFLTSKLIIFLHNNIKSLTDLPHMSYSLNPLDERPLCGLRLCIVG